MPEEFLDPLVQSLAIKRMGTPQSASSTGGAVRCRMAPSAA
jgi:hypothetical protein